MFSSQTYDSVGFSSVSEVVKTNAEASSQTSAINVKDQGEQSIKLSDKNLQSEPPGPKSDTVYDEKKLLNFLNKVTGPLLKELDKIERSKAFTALSSRDEYELTKDEVKELYILSGETLPNMSETRVSCLSWSCTGNVIAVGLESKSHEGWCTHESCAKFYNISSTKFDGKNPTNCIQTDSCITGISMHPHEPSIVAFGTHSGNIELWSVGKDNKLDGVCLSKEQYHDDKITHIQWANDTSSQLILVSSSLDGRMSVLKFSAGTCDLVDKYILDPESPDVLKPGVTCFSFCPKQPGTFVVGLESGQILLCSTFGINKNSADATIVPKSPALRPLHKKTGPITHIMFSPHEEHVFLVTALDFKITLYTIEQDSPLLDIYSDFDIMGASWSPVQAKTIIAWGTSPKLLVFNQDDGNVIAELLPDDEEALKRRNYLRALFNGKSPKLIALSGPKSDSYIWSIPTFFRN